MHKRITVKKSKHAAWIFFFVLIDKRDIMRYNETISSIKERVICIKVTVIKAPRAKGRISQ